nr:hypothetical protein [Microbacterium sp. ru370.1]
MTHCPVEGASTEAAIGRRAVCASITQCVITRRVRSKVAPSPPGVMKPVRVTGLPSKVSGFVACAKTADQSPMPNFEVSPDAARVTTSEPANSGGAPMSRETASSADSEAAGVRSTAITAPEASTPPVNAAIPPGVRRGRAARWSCAA